MAVFIVNASALRLRQSPSLSSKVLSALPRGTVVDSEAKTEWGAWCLVKTGKLEGWVATKYLVPEGSIGAAVGPAEEFPWMPIALSELGQAEVPGPASNTRILEYQRSTELDKDIAPNDAIPWCSDLVNWCVEKAGLGGTNSAAARSWLNWGKAIKKPRRGCVAVFSRGKTGGHVGFYVKQKAPLIWVLGGNQANNVSIASYDAGRLLGYRVPS